MPDMGETKAPKEASVLESRLTTVEDHIRRAHSIVNRMLPRESAKAVEASEGLVATTNKINTDLAELCGRLDGVADRVGLL